METRDSQELVDANIHRLKDALCLDEWRITVEYRRLDSLAPGTTCHGECIVLPEYLTAMIAVDPAAADTPEDLLRTVRHEMIHIFLASMEAVVKTLGDTKIPDAVYESVRSFHVERQVNAVERLLDRAGIAPPLVPPPTE